jgi:hypothetical protein
MLSFTDLWTEAIFIQTFSSSDLMEGRSRAFNVLWLDHVARSRGHTNHILPVVIGCCKDA